MFTNTFYHFLFGFAAIIGVAFAILIVADSQERSAPNPVDIIAQPQ